MRQAVVSVLFLFILSACTVGNKYDYSAATPDLVARSSAVIAVGVQDKRLYVVANDKQPDFVGLQRGGFGNPFDVTTRSGRALADDFAQSIVDALEKNGVEARPVVLPSEDDRKSALQKLASAGAERSIFVTLDEWKSDNLINVALIYNLSAEVLDSSGRLLSEARLQGRDALGAGLGATVVGGLVVAGYRQVLANLLNDEEIVAAIASAPSGSKVAGASAKLRGKAEADTSQVTAGTTTQSVKSTAPEPSEAERERVTSFIRNNDSKVKSRLASYNASNRIGRGANSTVSNIITIDDVSIHNVDGDRATVALGFSSGYRAFPSYHKYLYDVKLTSSDIVVLGHQKL